VKKIGKKAFPKLGITIVDIFCCRKPSEKEYLALAHTGANRFHIAPSGNLQRDKMKRLEAVCCFIPFVRALTHKKHQQLCALNQMEM